MPFGLSPPKTAKPSSWRLKTTLSDFYVADELITQMGTGEAMVTALNEKGMPTELVHTLMRPPYSRMDILNGEEISELTSRSPLVRKYNRDIDRESAHEILLERMEEQDARELQAKKAQTPGERPPGAVLHDRSPLSRKS